MTQTAKERFDEILGETEESPLERLRFFCSLAMNGQDWLDVEPFFDAISAPQTVRQDGEPTYGQLKIRLENALETVESQRVMLFDLRGRDCFSAADITERLQSAQDALLMCGNDFSDPLLDAIKEIETLRQRVKELETAMNKYSEDEMLLEVVSLREELAALKDRYLMLTNQTIRAEEKAEALEYELAALKKLSDQWHEYYRRKHHPNCALLESAGTDSLGNKCTCIECIKQDLAVLVANGNESEWVRLPDIPQED